MAKILVVDDEVGIREVVRGALSLKGYEVTTVPGASHALTVIFEEPFDLILLDINLTDESGITVLKKIKELRDKVPVVIYSGSLTPEFEKEAREAGADETLRKDIGIPQLVEQIDKIVKAKDRIFASPSEKKEKNILIIDDEAGIRRVLSEFFKTKGYKITEAESGERAIELVRLETFSVALLDINMTGMDGLATLKKILEIQPNLGVMMVTGNQDDESIKKAIELGAYGYVLKPFDFLYLELVVMSRLTIAGAG